MFLLSPCVISLMRWEVYHLARLVGGLFGFNKEGPTTDLNRLLQEQETRYRLTY